MYNCVFAQNSFILQLGFPENKRSFVFYFSKAATVTGCVHKNKAETNNIIGGCETARSRACSAENTCRRTLKHTRAIFTEIIGIIYEQTPAISALFYCYFFC